jgi:tetratricopeptide (TPR) repeat protein
MRIMSNSIRIALLAALPIATLAEDAVPPKYKPGDRVVVIRDAELRIPAGVIDEVWPGLVLKIGVVNDKWLWVSNGKPGWIDQNDVVPLGPKAIDRLNELVTANPDSSRLFSGRAAVYRELGDVERALADCTNAIRLAPQSAEAYNNRGFMWTEKEDFDKAISDFNTAITLDPNHAPAFDNRGLAWGAKGEYEKAIQDHTTAMQIDPNNGHYYNNRGNLHSALGDYEKALADFKNAVRLDPHEAVAYNNRGNARYFLNDYENALIDFTEAIRLDPSDPVAYNSRAVLRASCPDEKYRDGQKAIADATKACELTDWKDAETLDTLAAAQAESGDFDKAVEYAQKAIELAPDDDKPDLESRLKLYQEKKPFRKEQ